jgi:hypothetical protein
VLQVDLLVQPLAEPLDRLGGVVAAPVEPLVDRGLEAAAGRLEQRPHRQGRGGHDQARVRAQQLAEVKDHGGRSRHPAAP